MSYPSPYLHAIVGFLSRAITVLVPGRPRRNYLLVTKSTVCFKNQSLAQFCIS